MNLARFCALGRLLCSHCHGHTDKQQCNNFQLCHPGEKCFTTTYTINDGQPLFYTGCMADADCSNLHTTSVDQYGELPPGSDIKQQQCCSVDGCNGLQGSADRTACMSCPENEKYASQCQHATLCNPGQECMYYQFMDLETYQTRIHLGCVNHEVCEMFRSQPPIFGKREELAMDKHCCKTDYCNIFWDLKPLNSSNTHTTTTTTATSTTRPTEAATTTTPKTTSRMPLSFVTLTTASANNGQNTNNHTQSQVPSKTLVTLTNPPSKPVQQTTAPGQSSSTLVTAATVQHTPTVEQHTPTVEQHTPSVEQHTPAPQTQHTPTTVQQHIPTSAQQHSPTTFQLTQSSVDTQATPSTINVPNTLTPVTNTTAIPTTTMSKTAKPTTSMPTTKPTTIPTTTTEPPANRCYSSSKDSDTQSIVGCPDDAPYCLNSLTNYVNGKTEVEKV